MSLSYHYKLIYSDFKDLVENFSISSRETKLSILTGLTVVAAIIFSTAIQLPFPMWSGLSVLIVMKTNVGGAFDKGWMRFCGALIGAILSVFFFGLIAQSPVWFSIFTVVGVFLSFYLGTEAKYGYFFSYLFANMVLLFFIDFGNPYQNFPLLIAYYRALEIFIGVAFGFISSIILFPIFASDSMEKNIFSIIKGYMSLNIELLIQYRDKKKDLAKLNESLKFLSNDLYRLKILFLQYKNEKFLGFSNSTDYLSIINVLDELMLRTNILVNFYKSTSLEETIDDEFIKYAIIQLEKSSNIKNYTSMRFKLVLKRQSKLLATYLQSFTENSNFAIKNISSTYYLYLIKNIKTFISDLDSISTNKFKKNLEHSTEDITDDFNCDYVSFGEGFFRLRIYKPALSNAIKGALAVLVIFWINLWIQIPDGYLNMTVAIFTILGPNMNIINTKHKGILRLFGCAIGAAVGLLYLKFGITTAAVNFSIMAIIMILFSIVYNGKAGVSYLGVQACIAFLICTAFDFGPTQSIEPVFERLFGILITVVILWIFNSILFPEDFKNKLETRLISTRNFLLMYISQSFHSRNELGQFSFSSFKRNLLLKIEELTKICEYTDEISSQNVAQIKSWIEDIKNIGIYLHRINDLDQTKVDSFFNNYPKLKKQIESAMIFSLKNKSKNRSRIEKMVQRISVLADGIKNYQLPEKSFSSIVVNNSNEINTTEFSIIFYSISILESCKNIMLNDIYTLMENKFLTGKRSVSIKNNSKYATV